METLKIDDGGIKRVLQRAFLRIEVADRRPSIQAPARPDGPALGKQCFGEPCLARGRWPDDAAAFEAASPAERRRLHRAAFLREQRLAGMPVRARSRSSPTRAGASTATRCGGATPASPSPSRSW